MIIRYSDPLGNRNPSDPRRNAPHDIAWWGGISPDEDCAET